MVAQVEGRGQPAVVGVQVPALSEWLAGVPVAPGDRVSAETPWDQQVVPDEVLVEL